MIVLLVVASVIAYAFVGAMWAGLSLRWSWISEENAPLMVFAWPIIMPLLTLWAMVANTIDFFAGD